MIGLAVLLRSLWRGLRSIAGDPTARGLLTITAALIAGGSFFYRQVEGLSWIDSFYFTVVTLTTVGYGDISPQTTAGKLFTVAYLLIGIGILVALVGEVASHVLRANSKHGSPPDQLNGSREPSDES
jgi:voltage-gated potassium channel Kch